MGALSAEATGIDGIQLHWFDSPETRKQILRLVRLAETERFRSRELHEELFSAVRFDIGWTASSDDGLPPGSLEVEAWMRPMFRGLRHWRVLRLLRTVGMHHALGLRAAYLPCRLAPHVGALTTSLDLASGALTAGAVFERIWLRTTLLGAELQPFAASAVLSCRPANGLHRMFERHWWGLEPVSARPLANDGLPDWPCAGAVSSHNASIG